MTKLTNMLTRIRHGAFARTGGGSPTLADHIEAAGTFIGGSSRGDLGDMNTGYPDENDATGNPYADASKLAPWNSKQN